MSFLISVEYFILEFIVCICVAFSMSILFIYIVKGISHHKFSIVVGVLTAIIIGIRELIYSLVWRSDIVGVITNSIIGLIGGLLIGTIISYLLWSYLTHVVHKHNG